MYKFSFVIAAAMLFALMLAAAPVTAGSSSSAHNKVDVCHAEGNGSYHLVNIDAEALPAHLNHGDAEPFQEVPGGFETFFNASCDQVPTSCAAVLDADPDADPDAEDGEYDIGVDRPLFVYCNDMDGGDPKEYLTLVMTPPDAEANFSQYTAGGASPGTNVRTYYTKVRLDPATLTVDISDQTFSASSGSLIHSPWSVLSMPYGVAMACVGGNNPAGVANINLTGTPFKVVDTFQLGGAAPAGSAVKSSGDQVVDISGGGYCGWNTPAPWTYNPINASGGFQLDLDYL